MRNDLSYSYKKILCIAWIPFSSDSLCPSVSHPRTHKLNCELHSRASSCPFINHCIADLSVFLLLEHYARSVPSPPLVNKDQFFGWLISTFSRSFGRLCLIKYYITEHAFLCDLCPLSLHACHAYAIPLVGGLTSQKQPTVTKISER